MASNFQNRDDREAAQREKDSELERARKARHEKFVQNSGGSPAAPTPAPQQSGAPKQATVDVPKKATGAFEFQNRSKQDAYEKSLIQQQGDLRALQKERYNKFRQDGAPAQGAFSVPTGGGGQSVGRDSDSRKGQAPPEENAWYDPFGWFSGGGSSSSSGGGGGGYGGGGGGSGRPSGPRMKTLNDLPKPAKRG